MHWRNILLSAAVWLWVMQTVRRSISVRMSRTSSTQRTRKDSRGTLRQPISLREEFDGIISAAKENGFEIVALYHSHADHEAYFSEEDYAAQTVFGEPEFPDVLHVVVSVMNNKINGIKCYKWDGDTGTFLDLEECV